jgi:hypothetical protein
MQLPPFTTLWDPDGRRSVLSVPPRHDGFVRHSAGLLHLRPGVHKIDCHEVAAVFLVHLDGTHGLDLLSLGDAVLRGANGHRQPMHVLGRLVYGIARAALLVEYLEREQIHDAAEFERQLRRLTVELLANVFDGEALRAEEVSQHLDVVSGELVRRLEPELRRIGLVIHGLDLVAAPGPSPCREAQRA